MPIPPKPKLTEQQRIAAEEKFLNGTGGTNISVDGNEDNKNIKNVSKQRAKVKWYNIPVPEDICFNARIAALKLDITLGEYYIQAIKEKNERSI